MERSEIISRLVIFLALAVAFFYGYTTARHKYDKPVQGPDTVTITKWERDTIYEPKDSIIYKWRTAYLPVHDTTEVHDTTHTTDSVLVEVPISEKVYEGENYRATIRGYQAELADIWIKRRETTITVPYRKHWSLTLGPQGGVGITPKGIQPYAGFGATFGYSF